MSRTADTSNAANHREFDFALIATGVRELTADVENRLFEAGCDDATISMRHALLYLEFSRSAASLMDAIVSAIHDVEHAGIGASILRVDECDLLTMAEIARKIGRSRQLVHQYITGQRGPGGFPPPECHLSDQKPLWAWCAVSHWLVQHDLLPPEESRNADVVATINNTLEARRQRARHPDLVDELRQRLGVQY